MRVTDGRPPHPDTITRLFKKLAAAAGLPEIGLHDVRRSYDRDSRDANAAIFTSPASVSTPMSRAP